MAVPRSAASFVASMTMTATTVATIAAVATGTLAGCEAFAGPRSPGMRQLDAGRGPSFAPPPPTTEDAAASTDAALEPDGQDDAESDASGPCLPDCTGKVCGSNGCGGSCGSCPVEAPLCAAGECRPVCLPDCEDKVCGADGCGGSCGSCPPEVPLCVGGTCRPTCLPVCEGEGQACGSDGCGGSCGTCAGTTPCVDGKCQETPPFAPGE